MASLPDPVASREAHERVPERAEPVRRPARRRPLAGPPPSAERALAGHAAAIVRAIAADAVPLRWRLAGFAGDVDLARRQLSPLHDRRMLVDSFERESTRLAALRRLAQDPGAPPAPLVPVEAAYAVRWLELAEGGVPLAGWAEWLGRGAVLRAERAGSSPGGAGRPSSHEAPPGHETTPGRSR